MAMILFTNNNNYICTKYQHAARVLQIFVLYYPPPPKKKKPTETLRHLDIACEVTIAPWAM